MNSDEDKDKFYLSEEHTSRGRLLFAGCASGSILTQRVHQKYMDLVKANDGEKTIKCLTPIDRRFVGGEVVVRLTENVRGADAFIFQSFSNPTSPDSINDNIVSFMIAVRTLRQHHAQHVTGVLPYLAYARQDKSTYLMREPVTARLIADVILTSGLNHLITWAPHSSQQGLYGTAGIDALDAQTLLVQEFKRFFGRNDVIVVAPDDGAGKFVTRIAASLNLGYALAAKHRPKPGVAEIAHIVGNFTDKTTILIFDDMMASCGTMVALIEKIIHDYSNIQEVYIGVSHNLCLDSAYEALLHLHKNARLSGVVVTNSIPQTERFTALPFFKVLCLSETLARAINRIHYNESVSECFRPE
jgi:ribose-phosphate pyrophosphokinase